MQSIIDLNDLGELMNMVRVGDNVLAQVGLVCQLRSWVSCPLAETALLGGAPALAARRMQADLAGRDFAGERGSAVIVAADPAAAKSAEASAEERRAAEARHAAALRIPRRPAWDRGMSADAVRAQEDAMFLVWRRRLAQCAPRNALSRLPAISPSALVSCWRVFSLTRLHALRRGGAHVEIDAISSGGDEHAGVQARGGREPRHDALREEPGGVAAAVARAGAQRRHCAGVDL